MNLYDSLDAVRKSHQDQAFNSGTEKQCDFASVFCIFLFAMTYQYLYFCTKYTTNSRC